MSRKYKKRKYKSVSIDTAVNRYVKRHSNKMIEIFGSEHNARSILKAVPTFEQNYRDPKQATKDLNQYMRFITKDSSGNYSYNLDAAELYKAKKEAIESDDLNRTSMHKLTRKISKKYNPFTKDLGKKTNGAQDFDVSLLGYYDVKGEDYILAELEYTITPHTKFRTYEFIERTSLK